MKDKRIAVLIPCYNEAITIASVVKDFQAALPDADIYIYDNNSTDETYAIAQSLAAASRGEVHVRCEVQQGKGAVVRRMFRDIDADYYVMVDGDATYDASIAPEMLALAIDQHLDLVNAIRKETAIDAYRSGHRWGNVMLTGAVRKIFGNRVHDMLSGYKLFSKRFVKSFPATEQGFGIETELTIHALELDMPVGHVEGNYGGRPEGSVSKLNTYRDGFRILSLIIRLFKHERPFTLFGSLGLIFSLIAFGLFLPVFGEYLDTGLVPRLPTLIVSLGLGSIGMGCFFAGLILNTVTKGRKESKLLFYLNIN